ncbi:MAG: CxxxxCH/CxxCH domain-containing protein, partial [Myxococcales bacterium]|nr:CxxxxCH/CxxCH domain-containing protein [Myxococcales bacterium]
ITCSECHAPVVNASNVIVTPARHVDRVLDLDIGATGYQAGAQTCTITCHGQTHDQWYWTGPHPPGYDDPAVHGQEALQLTQDCTDCHGTDLRGGSGQSCDNCHQPGWRTNCTYCHGGANGDTEGLPPQDIDDQANEDLISFKAHPEHADGDIHPLWGCEVCHGNASRNYADAFTDAGHWIDSTPGVAEVAFTGDAAGTSYGGGNCTNSWCHGDGQTRGSSTDGTVALDCNGCHRYDFDLGAMSGTHALHLNDPTISCADCHDPIVDASGAITTPARHVDGNVDVATVAIGWDGTETCTNNCHQHQHNGVSWNGGHVPGYDDPLLHGQDALFLTLDCATAGCHGTDLQGGASGQGCDSCHTANWSQDCTYCHGGRLGDTEGLPPEDLDNTTNQNQITHKAHPEHADGDDHVAYGCEQCHGAVSLNYVDAKSDAGHWVDGTPGRAEVVFSAGLSPQGTYSFATSTCSNLYCHGNGRTNGSVTDSATAGTCNDCHPQNRLSGEHGRHLSVNSPCSDCHYSVVRNGQNVQFPELHVDGTTDVLMAPSTGINWNGSTCSGGRCHGVEHSHNGDRW